MSASHYNPDIEIPDLQGKVVFITGGTAGIGSATILHIIKHNPRAVFFSGRSSGSASSVLSQAQSIAPSVPVHFVKADLASLESVKAASEEFLSQCDRLDLLICNAGIMAVPPNLTKDGYEVQFGTNHLGHALLIQKLLPLLLRSAEDPKEDKRIVILSSNAYRGHPCGGILFDKVKTTQDSGPLGPSIRYAQSKLANILYASELARRYPNITSVSVHPGIIKTNLIDGMGPAMKLLVKVTVKRLEPEEGAYTTLWASFMKRSVVANGAMYEPVGVQTELNKTAMDAELAKKLWEWTERELRRYM